MVNTNSHPLGGFTNLMKIAVLFIQILLMAILWDVQRPIFDQNMKLNLKPLIPFTMLLLLLSMGLAATI